MSKYLGIFKFGRPRFHFAWISLTLLAIYGRTSNLGFQLGVPIVISGELVRIWSQGSIQKRIRLSDSGPYAYTRNPLYLGNFLIGLGCTIIFSNLFLLFLYFVGFFVIYHQTIKKEEEYLLGVYGKTFEDYCNSVPRFFPSLRPYTKRSGYPFDLNLVLHHGEPITICAVILLCLALYLRQEWYQNGLGFLSTHQELFYLVLGIGVLDLFFVVQRKFKRNPSAV